MKRLPILLVALALVAFVAPPKKVRLEYKFNQGDRFAYYVRADQVITQDIPQMGTQETKNVVESAVIFEAVDVDKEVTRFSVHYDYVTMKTENPMMGTIAVDTRNEEGTGPGSDLMYKMLTGLIDHEFFVSMTPNGIITEIEGAEELYEQVVAGLEGVNPQQAEALKSQVASQYEPEAMKENFQSGFVYYSGEKVKKKSSWTNDITTNAAIPGKSSLTWTLTDMGKEECTIAVEAEFQSDTERKVKVSMLDNVQWKIKGSTNGSYKVDPQNGWINTSNVEVSLQGTLEVPAGGMIPMDMSIPMDIQSKNNYAMDRL